MRSEHTRTMYIYTSYVCIWHTACSCCLLVCGPEKTNNKKAKNQAATWCTEINGQTLYKRCARSSFGITTTYAVPSFLVQGLGWLVATIALRQCPLKAEIRTMHPMRTNMTASAGQYHRPRHVDLALPLTVLAAGFASGTNPNPTGHP